MQHPHSTFINDSISITHSAITWRQCRKPFTLHTPRQCRHKLSSSYFDAITGVSFVFFANITSRDAIHITGGTTLELHFGYTFCRTYMQLFSNVNGPYLSDCLVWKCAGSPADRYSARFNKIKKLMQPCTCARNAQDHSVFQDSQDSQDSCVRCFLYASGFLYASVFHHFQSSTSAADAPLAWY